MWRAVRIVAAAFFILAGAPSNGSNGQAEQQQKKATAPARLANAPYPPTTGASPPCPGDNPHKLDCDTLSALANVRQAKAAERFNWIAIFEIGIGLATATAAIVAAFWAKRAAVAGTNSYRAFVAAEDASIDLTFTKGILVKQIAPDGARRSHFGFNVECTNVGRSVAKIHSCGAAKQRSDFVVDQLLDIRATETIAKRFIVEAREFVFELRYSSALHPSAVLSLTVQCYLLDGKTDQMAARIIKRTLSERKPI